MRRRPRLSWLRRFLRCRVAVTFTAAQILMHIRLLEIIPRIARTALLILIRRTRRRRFRRRVRRLRIATTPATRALLTRLCSRLIATVLPADISVLELRICRRFAIGTRGGNRFRHNAHSSPTARVSTWGRHRTLT